MGANANAQAAELVAHWKLDENAGVTVGDSSASALHGLISGPGVSWAPGVFGSALYFDASGDFVSIPHSAALDFTSSFALSFWIKGPPIQQGNGDGFATLINKAQGGANGFTGWAVYARASEPGAISFSLGNGTSFSEPRLQGVLDNAWHHVAILVDHSPTRSIQLFRDGQNIAGSADSSTTVANNTGPMDFGLYRNDVATAGPFEGQLDDVHMYGGELNSCAPAGWNDPNGALDCDQNGISDYCQSELNDCNRNCEPDALEIANCPPGELSCADCNMNGVLDACEPHALDAKITASDGGVDDLFGSSISISGQTIIVGSPNETTASGISAGSARVFVRTGATWTQQATLTASDSAQYDSFGAAVAINGDTAVIGAPWHDPSSAGSAYVFVRADGIWTEQAKLTAIDATSRVFGYSIALDGDSLVIGAIGDYHAGSASGSAFVFVRSGEAWTQQAKLIAADASTNDIFGNSVSISDDTAVIGAYQSGTSFTGSAYVFARSGAIWTQQAQLIASDAAQGDHFGYSVDIHDNNILIGAPYDDNAAGNNAGSAYMFTKTSGVWSQQAKLIARDSELANSLYFGGSVSLSGDNALIGATGGGVEGAYSEGSAYLFIRSNGAWMQHVKLKAIDAMEQDQFGTCVTHSGDTVVVGSPPDGNSAGPDAGSAYVTHIGTHCDGVPVPEVCNPLPPGVRVVRAGLLSGDGRSWSAPFATLQGALVAASNSGGAITQIWVAGDTYRPDFGNAQNLGNRSATFALQNNLAIYGGFACGDDKFSDRDPLTRPTILSGDLAGNDGPNFAGSGENSYHIVTAGPSVDATAVLDGFTIAGGVANGPGNDFRGGGLFCNGGSPTVSNCTFVGNYAGSGGAAYNQASSEAVYHRCVFSGNIAAGDGGAVVNEGGQTKYRSCLFSGNTSISGTGGAAYNVFSSVAYFSNCTISGNTALLGGGLGNNLASQAIVSNCILWNNQPSQIDLLTFNDTIVVTHSDIQGNWIGAGNINSNPLFLDSDGADNVPGTLDDDFHIPLWSPCIDRGEPGYVPPAGATTDIDGEQRVLGCRVDMGADEVSLGVAHSGDVDGNGETETNDVSLFVNVLLNGSGNCAADVNNDGNVNGLDVAFFVQLLLAP